MKKVLYWVSKTEYRQGFSDMKPLPGWDQSVVQVIRADNQRAELFYSCIVCLDTRKNRKLLDARLKAYEAWQKQEPSLQMVFIELNRK